MAALNLELQLACEVVSLPQEDDIRRVLEAAVRAAGKTAGNSPDHPAEIVVRVVDEDESRSLNRRYRGKDRSTNVLAFAPEPGATPGLPAGALETLGDLAVCGPVVEREAREQGKSVASHWAHMFVHGTLHLLGYDHQTDAEAAEMEGLEVRILADCGFADPYED